jgi:hypothetical protein
MPPLFSGIYKRESILYPPRYTDALFGGWLTDLD